MSLTVTRNIYEKDTPSEGWHENMLLKTGRKVTCYVVAESSVEVGPEYPTCKNCTEISKVLKEGLNSFYCLQ